MDERAQDCLSKKYIKLDILVKRLKKIEGREDPVKLNYKLVSRFIQTYYVGLLNTVIDYNASFKIKFSQFVSFVGATAR